MRCYDCAVEGKVEEAVGVCLSCGRATCLAHGTMQHVPQYRRSEGGIGGPMLRLPRDRPRWVCHECARAESETAEQSDEGRDG